MELLLLLLFLPGHLTQQCGLFKELQPDNEERITSGQTVAPNSIPWQAFILRWNGVTRGKNMLGMMIELVGQLMGLSSRSSCGGSLVSSYYVLTAKHCLRHDQRPKGVCVYLGRHFRTSGGTKYGVDKITSHPGSMIDLSLLRLDRSVTFSATISPVCLPAVSEASPSPGSQVLASGWGRTTPTDIDDGEGGSAKELQFIWLKVISSRDCIDLGNKAGRQKKCTLVKESKEDDYLNMTVCVVMPSSPKRGIEHGDSGGPLVALKDDRYTLVGVTSWGLSCSTEDTTGSFADVAKSIQWIKEMIGK